MTENKLNLESRISGALLGVAAGDALGATLEFMSAAQIRRKHGVHREIIGGGPFGWRPGQGTDDTDLTWAVLAAYLNGPFLLADVADNMLEWFHSRPPDIGGATSSALGRLSRTGNPHSTGNTGERSCGNGSLMRCIPTALARPVAAVRHRELTEVSAVTHAHVRCVDSCLAYGEIVNSLLEGAEVPDALAAARDLDLHPQVRAALDIDPGLPVEQLHTSGYVIHSLGCAIWAIQQDLPFEEVIVALVNRGDDSDTTGAIAGGLVGVLQGVDAIPHRWQRRLEYRDRLIAAVPHLLALRRQVADHTPTTGPP
jgi:ADP-ribosyl-[dinitrogen reductase] hydrolase